MLWFGIAFAIALTAALMAWADEDAVVGLIVFVFMALISGLVAFFLNIGFSNFNYQDAYRAEWTANLQNIRDGQSTHGSFFLGTGEVNSVPSYTYYMQNPDGSYSLQSVDAGSAKVFQDKTRPRIIAYKRVVTKQHGLLLSVLSAEVDENEYYEFHVPPGSIVNSYTLGK